MLSELPRSTRLRFLAIAVERSCRQADAAFRRVDLEILGNGDPFVHAHVWPRYEWEPPERDRGGTDGGSRLTLYSAETHSPYDLRGWPTCSTTTASAPRGTR